MGESLIEPLIALNRAYQEIINEKLEQLSKLLEENLNKQKQLQYELNETSTNQFEANIDSRNDQTKIDVEITKIKDNYFKYKFFMSPPENKALQQKNKLVLFEFIPQFKAEWNFKYRKKLKNAVLHDIRRLLKAPLINKINLLKEKLINYLRFKSNEKNSIQEQINKTNLALKSFDDLSELESIEKVDPNLIDWFKIANKDLDQRWSEVECRLVWLNACKLTINQEKWTKIEDNQLIELARKYREKNWKEIALKLNTNRSAYLCMKRYHEKTSASYCKRDWTIEESNKLLELTEKYRMGNYVPYNYLCYLIGSRDRSSLHAWYLRINPHINHGKWTDDEEKALVEALDYYNVQYNWYEISEYIGTRTPLQCKERYELKYLNPDKYINWTIEDDKKLLECYEKYSGHWVKIASEFPSRTDHACLFRYNKLMNWKKQNIWFENQPDEIKSFLEFACRNRKSEYKDVMRTNSGEVVPRIPKFMASSNFMSDIVDKIFMNKNLVYDFMRQKNEGLLNLSLLDKIGIQTPIIMNLMKRKAKQQQEKRSFYTTLQGAANSRRIKIKQKRLQSHIKSHVASNQENLQVGHFRITKAKSQKAQKIRDILARVNISQQLENNIENKNIQNIDIQKTELSQNLSSNRNITIKNKKYKNKLPKFNCKINVFQTQDLYEKPTTAKDQLSDLKSISPAKLSSIIKLNTVPEGTKIPCLIEEPNSFHYMYSLKKDTNNRYLDKYWIIDCRGKIVAIKPRNGVVNDDYLTEDKLNLIEKTLNQLFNINSKAQKPI